MSPYTYITENNLTHGKGTLFDLLPIDIINVIYLWLVGLKHRENFTAAMAQLNIPQTAILIINVN